MSITAGRWKGKARDMGVSRRDVTMEGSGGAGGVVLPLDQIDGGPYDISYSIPVKFGSNGQQYSLQIDTGSSDLWVASKSCSTSSCSLTQGRLYDPSGSRPTGKTFSIPYLQGSASGPIVWDMITLGGYSITNQALAAASDVENEPLEPEFSGILGLALPLNSIIAQQIPPVTSNAPDGAAWASNLFSITPTNEAPSARFLSLSLSRPGSNTVPALLGIGRHPAALVPDPSKIQYAGLVSDRNGVLFWKASVRAITVYVNGVPKPVSLGPSVSGGAFPSAVLDSGVPLILTTSPVANAIYGAIGVTPSSDGNYYVPCDTPLNLTITLDNRTETPVHPLDLTSEPQDSNTAQFCIGLIQPADAVLGSANNAIGDMILGVPFLRNIYTVMAYTPPNADGTFPLGTSSSPNSAGIAGDDDQPTTSAPTRVAPDINPALGILALTNPTIALAEFTTVRVLNQPLATSTATPPDTGANANTKTVSVGGKHLAVGLVVLIGLLGVFVVCIALFTGRWVLMKRRFRRERLAPNVGREGEGDLDRKTLYRLARRMSLSSGALGAVPLVRGTGSEERTEDELREMRYQNWKRIAEKQASEASTATDRTLLAGNTDALAVDEFGVGYRKHRGADDDDDEAWDAGATLVDKEKRRLADNPDNARAHIPTHTRGNLSEAMPLVSARDDRDSASPPSSPEHDTFPVHTRDYSDPAPGAHASTPSISVPLLTGARARTHSYADTIDAVAVSHARFFSVDSDRVAGEGDLLPLSPAAMLTPGGTPVHTTHPPSPGVRLAAVSMLPARQDSDRLVDPELALVLPHAGAGSRGAPMDDVADDVMGATGPMDEELGMAGIGSASRSSMTRFAGLGPRPSIDSLPFNRESLMSVSSVGTVIPGYALGSPSEAAEDQARGKVFP